MATMIQAPGALWDELASWLTDTELGRAASACAAMRSLLLEAMRPRAAERRWAEEREVARIERALQEHGRTPTSPCYGSDADSDLAL